MKPNKFVGNNLFCILTFHVNWRKVMVISVEEGGAYFFRSILTFSVLLGWVGDQLRKLTYRHIFSLYST